MGMGSSDSGFDVEHEVGIGAVDRAVKIDTAHVKSRLEGRCAEGPANLREGASQAEFGGHVAGANDH